MNNHRVILIVCYLVLFVIVLPLACRYKVFSVYSILDSKSSHALETHKSFYRSQRSKYFMKINDQKLIRRLHDNRLLMRNLDHLLVILIGVQNNEEGRTENGGNLYPLSEQLHRLVERDGGAGLFICDASNTTSAVLNDMYKFFPSNQVEIPYIDEPGVYFNKENKLKLAFKYCLKMVSKLVNDSTLITVFNDNVMPYKYFETDFRNIVKFKLDNRFSNGDYIPNPNRWLFLHLREPIHLRFFRLEGEALKEFCMIAVSGSVVFFIIFNYLDPRMSSGNCCFNIIFGAVFFLTFAICLGRPYLTELRRLGSNLYRVYDPQEAVDFSALSLKASTFKLIDPFLTNVTCTPYYPFSKLLDNMINTLQLPGYVVSPSLVRYV